MTEIQAVRDEFVRLWSRLGPFWGVPPSTARVHAFLLSSGEGADGEQISLALGMSRGAVSMACRELVDWGLVDRSTDGRRVLFAAETDLERAIRGIVRTRKRREWDPILENVEDWSSRLEGDGSKEAAALRSRFEDISAVVSMVDSMADSFLGGGVVQRLGLRAVVASARKRKSKSKTPSVEKPS